MTETPVHPLAPFLQPVRRWIRRTLLVLPGPLREFVLFGLKMAWSCLFGAGMLGLMIVTHLFWPANSPVYRYDFLLAAAIGIQCLLLWTRLETFDEVKVIFLYHVTGTIMEIFKTHMGSWTYPEPSIFHIGGVPLFTGFMYGSVGSFIARAIRVFDMRFSHYPKPWVTYLLALVIYVNFFTHHFLFDFRYLIFAAIAVIYFRCFVFFRIDQKVHSMPYLLAGTLTAFFLWLAENIGTFTHTWSYPGKAWHLVSIQKMGAWGLLLIISFVTVTLVFKPKIPEGEAEKVGGYRFWLKKTLAYRIAHVLTWFLLAVIVLVCVCMLALLILQVISQFELAILPYELFQLGNWLGGLFMWLFWSNYILLMLWAAFTNQSLQDVSPEELYHGPVMAALWFIIPLASLWKPYEVVTELYKASRNPMNWHNADRPGITGWWWAARILLSLTGIVANYASKTGSVDSTIILFLRIAMIAELFLQFIVVSKIGKQRFARREGLDVEQVF